MKEITKLDGNETVFYKGVAYNAAPFFFCSKTLYLTYMEYKYTGIILNKRDIGETDRLYTIFTREGGKIKSLAKGVRKPHAKLASSLETLTLADLTVVKNRGTGKIAGSIIENSYPNLKKDGAAMLAVFGAIGLFNKLVDLESQDQNLFALLADYLAAADEGARKHLEEEVSRLQALGFSLKLLEHSGYKIETTRCVLCGSRLSGEQFHFSAELGGIMDGRCASSQPGTITVGANTIKLMRILFSSSLRSLDKLKVEKKELDVLDRVLRAFLLWAA